jgi:SAM-dependent methyltransferase
MSWHPGIPDEYRNQIVTGDARELAKRIPDESVDLIFTDPVFQRVDDYEWLGETAQRVLRPGGNLIAECGMEQMPRVVAALSESLDYVWMLVERFSGGAPRMWVKRIMVLYAPYLWFSKGKRTGGWVTDALLGTASKEHHRWGDGLGFAPVYVDRLTELGAIVFDPFSGGGTIPAVCKMLGRNYIGFEIDPDTAARARQRVAQTQIPWFVEAPAQLELADVEPLPFTDWPIAGGEA